MQTARTAAESAWLQLMGEASPERPASRVAQLLLIGLSRQVNWTFADDGRGPSDQSAWGREGEGRSQRKPKGGQLPPSSGDGETHPEV